MNFFVLRAIRSEHPVVRFFASVKLTVVLLIVIGVACIVGTLIPQADTIAASPQELYKIYVGHYGPRLHVVFNILCFYRLYWSWWFSALLLLLTANMIVCSLRRFRWRRRQIGFQLTHLSIVFILAGVLVGLNAREGFMQITEGGQADTIAFQPRSPVADTAQEAERLTNEQRSGDVQAASRVRLPFAIRLDDFELRRHKEPLDTLMAQSVHGGEVFSYDLRSPKRIPRVAHQPLDVQLLETRPLLRRASQVVEQTTGPVEPAVEIEIALGDHRHAHWLFARGAAQRRQLTDECEVEYVRAATRAEFDLLLAQKAIPTTATPDCLGIVRSATDATTLPLALGKERLIRDADGTSLGVTVLRFFPHWNMNIETRQVFSASNERSNPAIEVRLREGETSETRWLFSRHPPAHGQRVFNLTTMTLQFIETQQRQSHFVRAVSVGDSPQRYLQHFVEGYLAATVSGATEQAVVTLPDKTQVRALHWLEHAAIDSRQEPDPNGFSALLRIRDVATGKEETFEAHSNEVYERGRVRFVLERNFPIDQFISRVRVIENDREMTTKTIEMNDPLKYRGYTVYQSSYDTEAGETSRYSVLSVKRDPGVWLIYLGFASLTIGLVTVFYINPWLRKEKKS